LFCPLDQMSFKTIRHGFMFSSQEGYRFFPFPSLRQIEESNFRFWQGM
jgi:hypothetical protein